MREWFTGDFYSDVYTILAASLTKKLKFTRDFNSDAYTILILIELKHGPYAHLGQWTLASDP